MCVQPVDDRCGRTGVRPFSFSEVEYGEREGGREYVMPLTKACSYGSAINPNERNKMELLLLLVY